VELYLKVRLAIRDGMSAREAARHFGISRESVKKMLSFSVPPGYRRMAPIKRPKLDGFTEIIDQWLGDDVGRPRKQRHTAKRVFDRLRDEHGFTGGYTIVKDYVRDQQRRRREMFVPLHHAPGHAQADFGEALVVIAGSSRKRTSSRSICRIAMRVTFGPIQRQPPRLGSTATFMLSLSSAGCRGRCSTTTTDAWWCASWRMAHANAPASSAGSCRIT